jgi:DNA-directed RNA polymerase subunit RPC12/RpoP
MSELNENHRAPLSCTNCRQTVVVTINRHATGNLTIECPRCGHEHYRYVVNGVITEDRWRSSAPMISSYYYSTAATSSTATYTSAGSGYLSNAWHSTTSGTNSW